ncbi:MAG: hypothetical protein L0323_16055 [Planctomycetes bacterium]|nr:hypothetical protein [Planctomycetota bacterium]
MDTKIPGMTVSWPWNPNHRYRFYVMGFDHVLRWLFTIRFSNKDQSVYVTPLYDREYAVQSVGSGQNSEFKHRPGSDFHLSLHESGVVNLTTSDARARLRERLDVRKDVRHVATFQINSIANLPTTTLTEINAPRGGHLYLPVVGFPSAPLMLTIICAKESANWSPPGMGNAMMLHYASRMQGKDYNFHFVQWQNLAMPKGAGDVGLQFGGGKDSLYGL